MNKNKELQESAQWIRMHLMYSMIDEHDWPLSGYLADKDDVIFRVSNIGLVYVINTVKKYYYAPHMWEQKFYKDLDEAIQDIERDHLRVVGNAKC